MSTQLRTIYGLKHHNPLLESKAEDLNPISLLQFSAGAKNGKMLQIRIGDSNQADSRVLLNKDQVETLRDALNTFLK